MMSIEEFKEEWREMREKGLFQGLQNPLKEGKSSRTALLFGAVFAAAETAFLIQGTPLTLVALEYGYAVLWLTAAFIEMHEKLRGNLFKALIAVLGIYYLLKFI